MASHLPSRSGWSEEPAQPSAAGPRRLRGAVWVIAALYIFCALVFTSWAEGWGENNPQAAAPPAAPQHSIHGAHG
jgi:hypothetical protein